MTITLNRSRDKLKHFSTTRVPMTTSLFRMITHLDSIIPIESHDPLILWSCEIIWQTKTIISLIPQCLWPPNLAGWWLTLSGFHPLSCLTHWWRDLGRSRDKLKPLYLYYCSPCYDHQTWQGGDLPWGAPMHIVLWPFNHVMTNQKYYDLAKN